MRIRLTVGQFNQDLEYAKIINALAGNKIIGDEMAHQRPGTWESADFLDNYEATDFAEELDLNLKSYMCSEYTIEVLF